eukprot:CAMPEP_0185778300 /NCGR_PEP_ID=MMETSP1174-20130828/92106_1 /TAXON_ID=35687 /ORGANISM="Dictyocha speculum, Strain CCMP1381" /LENGTH=52 /DNA_ID=CAMNT_0028466955 /DNA_START=684 /DNA_END=842 /DNA_ORIENTATION=+
MAGAVLLQLLELVRVGLKLRVAAHGEHEPQPDVRLGLIRGQSSGPTEGGHRT